MIYDRLANSIQKYAKVIIAMWLIILLCSSFFAVNLGDVIKYDINDMASQDSESIKGLHVMQEYYPASTADSSSMPIVVLYYEDDAGRTKAIAFAEELSSSASTGEYKYIVGVLSMDPTSKAGSGTPGIVMSIVSMDTTLTADLSTNATMNLTEEVRSFVNDVVQKTDYKGEHYVTGMSAVSYDMSVNAMEDISKIDPFTILMILVLVGLFFRSFVSSGAPPMVIGVAFVVTLALIYGLGQFLNIFFITNMLILVSMMGAGCDYCIFIIARYKEELRSGKTHEAALHEAVVWAGESITISGIAVIIGFGTMSICSYSMISTMGICLAVGIVVALLAALTLVPSILAVVGDRIFWPTRMKAYEEGGKATKGWYAWFSRRGASYFHKSAKFSIKRAGAIAVAAILVTVPAAYVVMESDTSYDMVTAMLTGEAGDGMKYVTTYADQGVVMPDIILMEYNGSLAQIDVPESSELEGITLGTLVWTDYYKNTVYPDLQKVEESIKKGDSNIKSVQLPFMWSDILDKLEKSGITDVDQKIQFVKDNVTAKYAMFFGNIVSALDESGLLKKEYIFDGPGGIISDNVKEIVDALKDFDFTWDEYVADAKKTGLTDPDEIIDYILDSLKDEEQGELKSQIVKTVVDTIEEQGVDKEILVNGLGSTITSAINTIIVKSQEIDLDWDKSVAAAKATGLTDPDAIINYIVKSFVKTDEDQIKGTLITSVINGIVSKGISKAILVNGYGSTVEAAVSQAASEYGMTIDLHWDSSVAAAKAAGYTKSDEIINYIADSLVKSEAEAPKKQIFLGVIDAFNEKGVTDDMLVYGMGSTVETALATVVVEISDMKIDWDKAVSDAKAKGLTDPDKIVTSILTEYLATQGETKTAILKSILDTLGAEIGTDIMVNGFGSTVDEAISLFVTEVSDMTVDWDAEVAVVKKTGITDPDKIVDKVLENYEEKNGETKGAILTMMVDTIRNYGISSEVLVNGFGPLLDYIINIGNSMVGGSFVKSETGSGSAEYLTLSIATIDAAMSNKSMESIAFVAGVVDQYANNHKSDVKETWNTGTAVIMYDVADTIKNQFTYIEILLIILIIILLFVVMRSYVIPLRSVLTILMSISWTLAATHIIFVDILGYQILWMIPLILLAICLGLGMDYDILLTTRIKENVMNKGMSNDDAIYNAVTSTGAVITICGLIMGGAFGTLMLSSMPLLQEIGFALCFAILIDALVVRTYVVPAIMHLLGDWNWKGPGYKKKFGRQ